MAFRTLGSGLIALVVLLACSSSRAATTLLQANLEGLQEVPPDASPGFGIGDFSYDSSTLTLTATAGSSYADLFAGATAITINDAALGANGPVLFSLTLDQPGAASGTFSGSGVLTPAAETDLLAGNTYVNIRSPVVPSGEIRGQLLVTPEPASIGLVGVVMAGTLFKHRRRA